MIYNVLFLSKRLVLQYDVLDNENKGGVLKRKVKVLQYGDVLDNEAKEKKGEENVKGTCIYIYIYINLTIY